MSFQQPNIDIVATDWTGVPDEAFMSALSVIIFTTEDVRDDHEDE